ncbi:MAG: FHA domain-containing protein [Actinomycetota bacterium]
MLEGEQVTVGKASSNDLAVPSDGSLSRLHAVFERFAAGWCLRDLSSMNGTFVNGDRLWQERPLRSGDQVRVGSLLMTYWSDSAVEDLTETERENSPPDLTARERDVLLSLCRPVLLGNAFTEPASVRQMARDLTVSEAAIRQHLVHLYDKFAIHGTDERRRVQLANEAIRRGAVSIAGLHRAPSGRSG